MQAFLSLFFFFQERGKYGNSVSHESGEQDPQNDPNALSAPGSVDNKALRFSPEVWQLDSFFFIVCSNLFSKTFDDIVVLALLLGSDLASRLRGKRAVSTTKWAGKTKIS